MSTTTPTPCDGNHGMPPCADPNCWQLPVPLPFSTAQALACVRAIADTCRSYNRNDKAQLIEHVCDLAELALSNPHIWEGERRELIPSPATAQAAHQYVLEHLGVDKWDVDHFAAVLADAQRMRAALARSADKAQGIDGRAMYYRGGAFHSDVFLRELQLACVKRLHEFKNAKGEPAHPPGTDWTLEQWSNALAGEVGEAASMLLEINTTFLNLVAGLESSNIAKKAHRGDYGPAHGHAPQTMELQAALDAFGLELADVVIYAAHCAHKAGRSLNDCVVEKFNAVSRRVGSVVQL